jgi:hypothetical protein
MLLLAAVADLRMNACRRSNSFHSSVRALLILGDDLELKLDLSQLAAPKLNGALLPLSGAPVDEEAAAHGVLLVRAALLRAGRGRGKEVEQFLVLSGWSDRVQSACPNATNPLGIEEVLERHHDIGAFGLKEIGERDYPPYRPTPKSRRSQPTRGVAGWTGRPAGAQSGPA